MRPALIPLLHLMQEKKRRLKFLNWELWPFPLRYFPLFPLWFWYCLKARSFWFFTASNPTITFGGFEGEGKEEMYNLLPQHLYPKTIFIQPGIEWNDVKHQVKTAGFTYPFCVKPDVGMKGLLFRWVHSEDELKVYHEAMPVLYMVQAIAEEKLEVSVFYYYFPWQQQGIISGFIQKDRLEVKGDGVHTIKQLILQHPLAKHRMEELRQKHEKNFETVPAAGETYILAHAANLNRGASFSSLHHHADEQLLAIFDDLCDRTQFYYGRYDIKCESVEALRQGRFTILEFNGAGAEPNHVYHAGYSWLAALLIIARHWQALYRISVYNHRKGLAYWSFSKGWKFLRASRRHFRLLEKLEGRVPV